ncbi:cell adhesion molecule 1-like isoform X1 [Solea solea]|uniref:cell adhesion molecule 1-like isoform X1 n=1 Tax=Solea solea TaxID=90069 RepID=UPI00272984EF|nr:cell adhesion molecule 1-like isoform X1 [Solea solea]
MFFILSVVSFMNLLCGYHVLGCVMNCPHRSEVSPSRLVVKHGDPASAVCSLCQSCQSKESLGLEVSLGRKTGNATVLLWSVDRMTLWGTSALCFYNDLSARVCCTELPVTVYKPPDSVSISFTNHSGPMFEGHQYALQCEVHNVAPVANLTVTFYRGWTTLGQLHLDSSVLEPVTEVFTHNFYATGEDDGAQFWCQGVLELGPEGPQHPPVVKSQNITATVHYKPRQVESSRPGPIIVTEGDSLQLNCSAVGNPSPSYRWELPQPTHRHVTGDRHVINSITPKDEGRYVCHVSNDVGALSVSFEVVVKGLELTSPPQSSTTSTKATTTKTTVAPNSSTSITLTHGFIMCVLLLFSAVI